MCVCVSECNTFSVSSWCMFFSSVFISLSFAAFFCVFVYASKLVRTCMYFSSWSTDVSLACFQTWRHYQPFIPVTVLAVKPGEYPELRLKAFTSRVMTTFLSVCLQDLYSHVPNDQVDRELLLATVAVAKLSNWMLQLERTPRYMTRQQAIDLHDLSWEFLGCYFWLNLIDSKCNVFFCWSSDVAGTTQLPGFSTRISNWQCGPWNVRFSDGLSSRSFMYLFLDSIVLFERLVCTVTQLG